MGEKTGEEGVVRQRMAAPPMLIGIHQIRELSEREEADPQRQNDRWNREVDGPELIDVLNRERTVFEDTQQRQIPKDPEPERSPSAVSIGRCIQESADAEIER